MLYIWPYFAFFSWPLLVPLVLNVLLPRKLLPKYLDYGLPEKQRRLPSFLAALIVLPIMLAVVHFNTIVHPFTLADNRHYIFYVFRLLLGVHPAIKYAAVLAYFYCGWAVISAFGFSSIPKPPRFVQVPSTAKPAAPGAKSAVAEQPKESRKSLRSARKTAPKKGKPSQQQPDPTSPEVVARIQEHLIQRQKQLAEAPRVSLVLVWLAATTLSLVTAPLVEPRYFIIPWVMWRLHLPPSPTPAAFRQRSGDDNERARADFATNASKFLETLWFIAINAVTGYVFLYKGFEWAQEPGKAQRFMW